MERKAAAGGRGDLGRPEDVGFCRLTAHDVVRHKLVGKIVEAYDR